VLGNLLSLQGFEFESSEQVRDAALGDVATLSTRLSNAVSADWAAVSTSAAPSASTTSLQRLADVPIYATDALVRRAPSLQRTVDARPPRAGIAPGLWQQLGLQPGDAVRVVQGGGHAVLPAVLEATLAEGVVRVPAGHADTASLGAMTGALTIEPVARAGASGAAATRAEGVAA
jgi:NADH-quinone oxidoreductase subunit G